MPDGPFVVSRAGDLSLAFVDKDGNRQVASIGTGFPILVDVLTDLLRDILEEIRAVRVAIEVITEVEDATTRR